MNDYYIERYIEYHGIISQNPFNATSSYSAFRCILQSRQINERMRWGAISDQRHRSHGNRFLVSLTVIYEDLKYSGSKVIDLCPLRERQVFRRSVLDRNVEKWGRRWLRRRLRELIVRTTRLT